MDELDKKLEELDRRLNRLETHMEETIKIVKNSKSIEETIVALGQLDDIWEIG